METLITGRIGSDDEERNRRLVLDFYENVIGKRQYDRWPDYLHPDYIQHKPNIGDGPQGVIDFMRDNYARYPRHTPEIIRSFVDGDYVFLRACAYGTAQPRHRRHGYLPLRRRQAGRALGCGAARTHRDEARERHVLVVAKKQVATSAEAGHRSVLSMTPAPDDPSAQM